MARRDWLNKPLAELNTMFGNIEAKIAGYKVRYGLTDDWVSRLRSICTNFQAGYAGIMSARATMKDSNEWFEIFLYGEPQGAPAPPPPVFQSIILSAGATIGLMDEFREMIGFLKANAAYTEADGENLMIVATDEEEDDPANAQPNLKASVDTNGQVTVEYTRGDFSGLELQWRKSGEALWQFVDKSTERVIAFTPDGITPPQNIELRGIYLLKNKRVGQWSPVYSLTIS